MIMFRPTGVGHTAAVRGHKLDIHLDIYRACMITLICRPFASRSGAT